MSPNEWPPKRPSNRSEPKLERVRLLWRVEGIGGRVWECVLYRVETGQELRVQPAGKEDAAVQTQLLRKGDDAEALAESWRAALVKKGFKDLP